MAMVRLKAPQGATSISIAGNEFEVEDGYLSVPEMYKTIAESHGYGKQAERLDLDRVALDAVSTLTPEKVAAMGRGELLIYCDDHRIEVPPRTSIDDLRKLVWADVKTQQDIVRKASGKK